MEKESPEPTENPVILDSVSAEQFGLRAFTNEQGKDEFHVVKFDAAGGPDMLMTNGPVALPENVSVHVDNTGRLMFHVSGAIDGLTGDLGGGGDPGPIATGLIADLPVGLNKKGPQTLLPSPDAPPPGIRTEDGIFQGRVSSIMGNVADCLRILPDADPLDCMEAAVQAAAVTTATPATSSTPASCFTAVITSMQDSLPSQADGCGMSIAPDIHGGPGTPEATAAESAGAGADDIAPPVTLMQSSEDTLTQVSITEVMANMSRTTESHGTCSSLPTSMPIDAISLPSLVSIGVPNVELTTTGQLVISRGSLVYTDQSSGLLTMPSPVPCNTAPLKENTVKSNIPDKNQPKVKRKGGWPKGKKRKRNPLKEPNVPKAPTTAYSLFLNEQLEQMKKKHSKKPFPEIIKILGSMWTKMTAEGKKKYMNEAAMDKKRYIDELHTFQHSETYQTLLRRQVAKKIRDLTGVDGATIDPDVSASVLNDIHLEEDDPNDLLCKICDQCFSTVHNKKEHMYGKQHLLTLTGKLCEIEKEVLEMENGNQELAGPSLMDPHAHDLEPGSALTPAVGGPGGGAAGASSMTDATGCPQHPMLPVKIDIEQFKEGFMELNLDREIELRELRCRDQELFELNMHLSTQCQHLQESLDKRTLEVNDLRRVGTTLRAKLEGVRMVPTLFGVIRF